MSDEDEESVLTTIHSRDDSRSDFDKAFSEDPLYQLQNRMLAKDKTKKFTAEDFVAKAKAEFAEELELIDELASGEETPEPEEEPEFKFF